MRFLSCRMAGFLRFLLLFVLFVPAGQSTAQEQASEFAYVKSWTVSMGGRITAASIVEFPDPGVTVETQLLAVSPDDRLELRALPAVSRTDGPLFANAGAPAPELLETMVSDGPFSADITQIVQADLNGDGTGEIVVGTGGPGTIIVYTFDPAHNVLDRVFESPYLWSGVETIKSCQLDSFAGAELLVRTEAGETRIYGWQDGYLAEIYRAPAGDSRIMVPSDLDGDGSDELIVYGESGRIEALKFVDGSLRELWSNYVWGNVIGLVSGDIDGDGQNEVVFWTMYKMLYIYSWSQESQTLIKESQSSLSRTLEGKHEIIDVNLDGRAELMSLGSSNPGIRVETIGTSGPQLIWSTEGGEQYVGILPSGRSMLSWTGEGELSYWRIVDSGYLELSVDGVPRSLSAKPVYQEGRVYLSARDVVNIFGGTLSYDQNKRRVTVLRGDRYAELEIDTGLVIVSGVAAGYVPPPLMRDGRTFMPLEFVSMGLGGLVDWDPMSRKLSISTGIPSKTADPGTGGAEEFRSFGIR